MSELKGNGTVPSLPPPQPKSPPELYGRRRELAKVQMLEREIGFLEEELKSIEGLQLASRSCKEVADFVVANVDPLIPTTKKTRRSCLFWKWLCGGLSCFKVSWVCCCDCPSRLKKPNCCCKCNSCSSCCNPCGECSIPKCHCFSCSESRCCDVPKCRMHCCSCWSRPKCPSCPTCSCMSCKCCPKCFSLKNTCSCCQKSCCYPCYLC